MAPQYNVHPERRYSIAVVGGGIGGLCTVIGLLRQGIQVHIYEAAHRFEEIGAGVSFGPNAAKAMQLIDPAIHAGFSRCMTNNAWPDKRKVWFSWRKGQDPDSKLGTWIYDTICESGQASVHRARYLKELIALVPGGVAHFGKRLEDMEDNGQEVTLKFADGSTARHSALIGCDGIKSKVRPTLIGDSHQAAHAIFSGKYAYRGLIPMSDAARVVGDELARNSQMYVGHGGHILTFPIEHGETMNVVAFGTKDDGKWEDSDWVKPVDREGMLRDFEGWTDSTRAILSLMQKCDVWALFHHPPAPTYHKGRICLLGDAAHASTPHNGAGAGQAIEDALIMSRTMALVFRSQDIEKAFAAFDRVRRPRSQRHVRASAESGWLYDLQEEGVGDDLEKLKQRLAVQQRFLWDHDLEADVREAERLFKEERGEAKS